MSGFAQQIAPYDASSKIQDAGSFVITAASETPLLAPTEGPGLLDLLPAIIANPELYPTQATLLCKIGLIFALNCAFGGTYFLGIDVDDQYIIEFIRVLNENDGEFNAADCNAASVNVQPADPATVYPTPPAGKEVGAVSVEVESGSGTANVRLAAYCLEKLQ